MLGKKISVDRQLFINEKVEKGKSESKNPLQFFELENQFFNWLKNVRTSTKSPLCGGSSGCRDDGATKNTSTGQDKARGDDGHLSKAAAARDH